MDKKLFKKILGQKLVQEMSLGVFSGKLNEWPGMSIGGSPLTASRLIIFLTVAEIGRLHQLIYVKLGPQNVHFLEGFYGKYIAWFLGGQNLYFSWFWGVIYTYILFFGMRIPQDARMRDLSLTRHVAYFLGQQGSRSYNLSSECPSKESLGFGETHPILKCQNGTILGAPKNFWNKNFSTEKSKWRKGESKSIVSSNWSDFLVGHLINSCFLVPLIGGRCHKITQLAIYRWYILPIGWLYGTYHLLGEPENSIDLIEIRPHSNIVSWNPVSFWLFLNESHGGHFCEMFFFSSFSSSSCLPECKP